MDHLSPLHIRFIENFLNISPANMCWWHQSLHSGTERSLIYTQTRSRLYGKRGKAGNYTFNHFPFLKFNHTKMDSHRHDVSY